MNNKCAGLLVGLWLLMAASSHAALTVNNQAAVGAAVTSPWLVAGDRMTLVTLTNGIGAWTKVHVTTVDADWQALDFDCELSPLETTYFIFEAHTVGSKVTSECSSQAAGNLGIVQTRFIPGERNGFVVFHHTESVQSTIPLNVLISDFTVIDFDQGYAFSANAWHLPAITGSTDQNLALDNTEFAELPSVLATSFIAPDDDITAELILYTLNGRVGWPAGATVGGVLYDDDEQPVSNTYHYDCFTIVSLQDVFGLSVDRRNGPGGSPYFVGHVSLFALFDPAAYAGVQAPPGAVAASVGWIVQTLADLGDLNDNAPLGLQPNFGSSMPSQGAWARQLLSAMSSVPNHFDADPAIDP